MSTAELDPRTPVLVGVGQSSDRDRRARLRAACRPSSSPPRPPGRRWPTAAPTPATWPAPSTSSPPCGSSRCRRRCRRRRSAAPTTSPARSRPRIGADPARARPRGRGRPVAAAPRHRARRARSPAGEPRSSWSSAARRSRPCAALAGADDRPGLDRARRAGSWRTAATGWRGSRRATSWRHGLSDAPSQYALFETRPTGPHRADPRGSTPSTMGRLFAPFTEVAAANPHAAAASSGRPRSWRRSTEAQPAGRRPYPRLLVARDQVNQGAAVLLDVGRRRRGGSACRRTAGSSCTAAPTCASVDLLERADLGAQPGRGRSPSSTPSRSPASALDDLGAPRPLQLLPDRGVEPAATGSGSPPTTRAG